MKREINNAVDLSSKIENIARGEGFYSVFISEHQRNSRPARKSINGLKELFKLLYNPIDEMFCEEGGLDKLSHFTDKVLTIYKNSDPKEFLRKLRKRILKICERMKSENINEFPNPLIEQDNNKSFVNDPTEQDLDEDQKNLIYNMLLNNGVSPEEALNELIKY